MEVRGIVSAETVTPVVNARLRGEGWSHEGARRLPFRLELADGSRVRIETADIPAPARLAPVGGPWSEVRRELGADVVQLPNEPAPDEHVTLRRWLVCSGDEVLVVGEPVRAVLEKPSEGYRDAPDTVIEALRATHVDILKESPRRLRASFTVTSVRAGRVDGADEAPPVVRRSGRRGQAGPSTGMGYGAALALQIGAALLLGLFAFLGNCRGDW